MNFTSFPASPVCPRIGISRSASETDDSFYLSAQLALLKWIQMEGIFVMSSVAEKKNINDLKNLNRQNMSKLVTLIFTSKEWE